MSALIIGAGATGQVFARVLNQARIPVSFFVKPAHVSEVQRGFTLYDLRKKNAAPEIVNGFQVYSDREAIQNQDWDWVFLCVSGSALFQPEMETLLRACVKPKTALVSIQVGRANEVRLKQMVPEAQLTMLSVSFLSYRVKEGMGVFPIPMGPAQISGEDPRIPELMRILKRGGYPVNRVESAADAVALPDILLNLTVYVLEQTGWKIDQLARDPKSLQQLSDGMKDAMQAMAKKLRVRSFPFLLVARPSVLMLLLKVARFFAPFPLEEFLRSHFSRQHDQTVLRLKYYITVVEETGGDPHVLRSLLERA